MRVFRRLVYGVTTLLMFSTQFLYSQCPFDPTIIPAAPVLCPETVDTLHTETYDVYQWYKNGSPIAGADTSFLEISAYADAGYYFFVEVTLAGCTERSDSILVDGWVFLPPVASTNPMPVIFGGSGEAYFCHGDTAYIDALNPLVNIQWYRNGAVIPGATGSQLVVITDGDYTFTANYATCPASEANLGVEVPIRFLPAFVPVIQASGSDIYTDDGSGWQWYFNGSPVAGATDSLFNNPADGSYYVTALDSNGCEGQSAIYTVGTASTDPGDEVIFSMYPNPAHTWVKIQTATGAPVSYQLTDLSGKVLMAGQQTSQIDCTGLSNGIYMLTIDMGNKKSSKKLIISH